MYYIVYLSVEGLYASFLGLGSDEPVVIHRDRVVIDATPAARQVGARLGTTLTEAKAMLSGVKFVGWNSDDDFDARDRWLAPYVELTDWIEPGAPHEAYLDLTAHPDPMSLLTTIAKVASLPVRLGLGASKWIARVSATDPRSGVPSSDFVVRPMTALKRFPTSCLPIPADVHDRLVFLGYRTVGDVQQAPLEVLKKQFGPIGSVIYQSARGGCQQLVEAMYPDATIAARHQLRSAWKSLEERDADLRKLATRLAQPLVDADQSARTLSLTLVDEQDDRLVRDRTYSKPLRTGLQIFSALKGMCSLDEGFEVIEVRARLSDLDHAPARQYELTRMRTGAPDDSMKDAMESIQATFGHQSVIAGSEWRPPRRQVVMKAWKDATGWV